MSSVRPIETAYRGYRFRSRTEARWAVFFQILGLRWEYEAEGYKLPNGQWYLPDFKLVLPNDEIVFAEVKPDEFDDFSDSELETLRSLADGLNARVVLLTGIPGQRAYNQILPQTGKNSLSLAFFRDYGDLLCTADNYWMQMMRFDTSTGRLHFDMDERRLAKAFGNAFVKAVRASRSARFEHGESPEMRRRT